MSSLSPRSASSRPPDGNTTTSAIGQGLSTSQFPRRAHARPVNIPERRLWSAHDRPKFYIRDSSDSSQGGSSTKSSGGSSTTSEGREGSRVHTVSPYGSFFVGDMDLDSDTPGDSNSPSRGGGWTRGRTADSNSALYQASTRRPPSSQNGLYRRQPPVIPGGRFDTTEPTYFRMPGALPVPGRNASREAEGTPSTVTTSTHPSQSNHLTSWNREYRNGSNSPHNRHHDSLAHQPQVVTGTALPLESSLSIYEGRKTRGVTRTTWRK
jgi:hypothetical protein